MILAVYAIGILIIAMIQHDRIRTLEFRIRQLRKRNNELTMNQCKRKTKDRKC